MPVTLGAAPQPGFDQPIALMMDCHRRIERFLQMLLHITRELHGRSLPDEYREALHTALNYFHAAAPRHTEDEEDSLFPRLCQVDDPAVRDATQTIARLEADHDMAEAHHHAVDALGRRWLEEDQLPTEDVERLLKLLSELHEAYSRHIALEDTLIFPLAQQKLSAAQLQEIGREMAQRRAINPGREESRCAQRRLAARSAQEAERDP